MSATRPGGMHKEREGVQDDEVVFALRMGLNKII